MLERVADRETWNALCRDFAGAEFTQSYEWGAARLGWQPVRWALRVDGEVRAVAQLLIKAKWGLSLVYCPRGPLWQRHGLDHGTQLAGLGRMLEALTREYSSAVVVCDLHDDRDELPAETLHGRGFRPMSEGMTAIIDLQQEPGAIRAAFHRKWRNDLQKAESSGLEIRRHEPQAFLEPLYALAHATAERKKFSVGVSQDVAGRYLSQGAPGTAAIFSAHTPDGSVTSAALIVRCHQRAGYLVGASVHNTHAAFSRGASNLVQWHALQWAKASGCLAYNLEGLDPRGNPGVYHFKERMNGKLRHTRGMWVWSRSVVLTLAARAILRRMVN